MDTVNIPVLTDEDIAAQNGLTPLLSKKMPEVIIGNYSISLLEVHWVLISLQRGFHTHRFLEIHIPFLGQGKIFTKEKQSFYKPGSFTITPPNLPHAWECLSPPQQMQVWWLAIRPLRQKIHDPVNEIIKNILSADNMTYPLHPFFYEAFNLMLEEIASVQAGSELILKSLFRQMIILLGRAVKSIPSNLKRSRVKKTNKLSDRILLSRVDEFIQSNLQHELTLNEIADYLDISPRTLTRRYRKSREQTVWQTITQMRMTKAKVLLQDSSLSVYEVAERCGIYNKHYFSECFNKYFGLSPSGFRKKLKLRKDDD